MFWNVKLRSPACCVLHAGFLLSLLLNPGEGGNMFLRNGSCISTGYTALYLRRQNIS
jgi:hypothetical protein